MAGRGRGRGRGGLSFSTDTLGIQRGDIISIPGLQPPPLFPVSLLELDFLFLNPCSSKCC